MKFQTIVTTSDNTAIIHNMVALVEWTGTYQDRYEPGNSRWEAGIKATGAKRLTLRDNIVTASERVGFRVPPLACGEISDRYRNNMAFGNLIGVEILPEDPLFVTCAEYTGFILWKNHDFGIYYQGSSSVRLRNNILVDNRQGIWTGIAGPSARMHVIGSKTAEIADSLIIGASAAYDCARDISPNDNNMKLSAIARPGMAPNGGMIGLVFPNFMSVSNSAPRGRFTGISSYSAIAGLMKLKNITFAHFGPSLFGGAYCIATNVNNDDGQHPVEAKQIAMYSVKDDYKIVYHRPNIGKINPADCVDMDCDGMKKALFKDLDGTFLGHKGAVIPQSEFEWNANPNRCLGDHRIPKEMATYLNGTRIPYDDIAPYKGIIRNSNCTYRAHWQAYECGADLNYEMLIIESMDSDTETRRLSPVAILGDGYVDLINGPQDHSWCTNYACRKRLSTFMALVATEKEYLMHFTSTTPFHMRYHLLNTDTEAIKLTVWYSRPNRLDVYVDGNYIMATNARINHLGFYVLEMPIADEYEPKLSDATGTNKVDHERGEHTIIIKGPTPVEVITHPMIIVSFGLPAMTIEDFYGANIVENVAAFLNIPLTDVRVVNVVSENSKRRRHKRNSEGTQVEVEIGDEPSLNLTETVPDSFDIASLLNLASDIVNECQIGDLKVSLNLTGICESVEVPAVSANDSLVIYGTPRPERLVFTVEPVPDYENVPLKIQPKLQAVDAQAVPLTVLGTVEHPWQIEVSIRRGTGHPEAVLSGTLQVSASNGWFNFTDLAISHMETEYILDFNVTYPKAAREFTLSTTPFEVTWPPLKAHVVTKTDADILCYAEFSLGIDLRNSLTGAVVNDIGWRNHTWYAEVDMLGNPKYGKLQGVLSTVFNPVTGRALFPHLKITGFGFFYVQFRVNSDPSDFNLTLNEKMIIMNPDHVGMVAEEQYEIQVKFDVGYEKILPTVDKENEFEQMILSEYTNTWPDVSMRSGYIGQGSITVAFVMEGSVTDLNTMAYGLCNSIASSTNYTFYDYTLSLDKYMSVNNSTFYGVACPAKEQTNSYVLIIAIVVALGFLIIVVGAVVTWKCCFGKTTIPKDMVPPGPQYIGKDNEQVVEQLFKESTFTIRRKIRPPTSTEIAHLPQPPNPRPLFLAPVDTYIEHPFGTLMNNYPQLERTKELPLMRESSGLSVSTLSVHVDPAIQNESPAYKNDF